MPKKVITPKDPKAQDKDDNEAAKSAERKTAAASYKGRKVARKTAYTKAGH